MSKRGGKRGERVKGERGRSKRNKERGTKRKERREKERLRYILETKRNTNVRTGEKLVAYSREGSLS